MTPSYDLRCPDCHRLHNKLPFLVLCTGTVRYVPHTNDGLIYALCKCGTKARYEIVATTTQEIAA